MGTMLRVEADLFITGKDSLFCKQSRPMRDARIADHPIGAAAPE